LRLAAFTFPEFDPETVPGSNAFALAGNHTASGAGLLANDPHLGHAVPNVWYRALLSYAGRRAVGATLPGLPLVVAGSNGDVAWGCTNAYADTGDLVVVETNSIAKHLYKAPGHDDFLAIEQRQETFQVRGEQPVTAEYDWTIWGPIIGTNERQRPLAYRWVAHDPEAVNLQLLGMEQARTIDEALAVAHRAGVPHQNLILADRAGEVAWTLAGRLPRRAGYDGRLPVTWSFGDRRWNGYLSPAEVPVVRGPESILPGKVWSANQRQVGGPALARLGDGGYATPGRAEQVRDGLSALTRAIPRDLLAVQLDDRAPHLQRWHARLLAVLTPAATAAHPARAALRRHAEAWEGHASVDAVAYRVVRAYRQAVRQRVFAPIFAPCIEKLPGFNWRRFNTEPALETILRELPLHLLDPRFASWDDLLLAAVDDAIAALAKSGPPLPQGTWGEVNRARIRHPLSGAIPLVGPWLDLPADSLPGDPGLPRAQGPAHGVSLRLVVSPGREDEGLFHMPGGQSGHPLSPFYRAGHTAWVRGEPSPLLPGPPQYRLLLQP
jgi:penicillin amidase